MCSRKQMADRTRPRAGGNEDRVSISSLEDHHPTKKSRDSNHQWSLDIPMTGRIKSLMDIDFEMGNTGGMNPGHHQEQYVPGNMESDGQNGQHSYPIASLMDVHLLRAQQPPGLHPTDVAAAAAAAAAAQGQAASLHPGSMLPYMVALPAASGPSHPSTACIPALAYHHPFPSPVTPLMPLQSQGPAAVPSLQPTPILQQPPAPMAPLEKYNPVCTLPGPDGGIPSLLDLPLLGGRPAAAEPQALLPGLPAREAEFEQLMERLCTSVRTRLPMCCVSPVKALETALQRCRLPRGVRKYKQVQKGLPILCKLYVNNLLIGAGVGDSTRAADAKAYGRALRLLRETAFEDILFGMPLREEITELMTNLPQRQPPSPKSHRRFVVLEDRKPEQGSNSFYILMLSAQFSGRNITLSTEREENGRCCVKVSLEEEELASASGENEMEVKRNASNQALSKLKTSCPAIEIISNGEKWKNSIQKNLRAKLEERFESIESHISKPRLPDEPIVLSTNQLSLKAPVASLSTNDLEELFCQVLDIYQQQQIINPLVIAPLRARSQRLLLFRLARQLSLCSETIRLSPNMGHDLSLVSVIKRRLEANTLLPVLESADGHCTEQFQLYPETVKADSVDAEEVLSQDTVKVDDDSVRKIC